MEKCVIPEIFCGRGKINKNIQIKNGVMIVNTRSGDNYECFQKGYAICLDKSAKYSKYSLRNIRYIGKTYENNFKNSGISNIKDLIKKAISLEKINFQKLIKKNILRNNGYYDVKAYNAIISYLYHVHNIKNLPECSNILKK